MRIKHLFASFCFTQLTVLVLLYMIRYVTVELHLNFVVLFWAGFTMACVGLAWNIYFFLVGDDFGVHDFFLHAIPVSFGFIPLCFLTESKNLIGDAGWMSVLAAVYFVIALMGYITHWQLSYEELMEPTK